MSPLPRTVEQLERFWLAVPAAAVWYLTLEGCWPTLEEQCQRREAESAQAR